MDAQLCKSDGEREDKLALLVVNAEFQNCILSNPVFIHAVCISTSEGLARGFQTMQFRAQAVRVQMKAGIARAALDQIRPFIERWVSHNVKLTYSNNLGKFIPGILSMEITTLRFETRGCKVWVIFDGATHHCAEALPVVFRWVRDLKMHNRCIGLRHYAGSFSGQTMMVTLDRTISEDMQVPKEDTYGMTHDLCPANTKCMRMAENVGGYEQCFDGPCGSHPTAGTIGKMEHEHLDEVFKPIAIFYIYATL